MASVQDHDELNRLLGLWDDVHTKFPEWRGIGECQAGLTSFISTDGPSSDLKKMISNLDVAIRFERLLGFPARQQSVSLPSDKFLKTTNRSTTLKPGTGIVAFNPSRGCQRTGCSGTAGAFLQFIPCGSDPRIWILSCGHVLARAGDCAPTQIFDEDSKLISRNVSVASPQPLPAHPLLDTAAAELDSPDIADPNYLPLNVKFGMPAQPTPNGRVTVSIKDGAGKSRLLEGEIRCACPVMNIDDCDKKGSSSPRSNLIMIGSIQGKAPFLVSDSDSGSLVVNEDGHPVAIISAGDVDEFGSPVAFATDLFTAISKLEEVLRTTSSAPPDSRLQIMLKKCG